MVDLARLQCAFTILTMDAERFPPNYWIELCDRHIATFEGNISHAQLRSAAYSHRFGTNQFEEAMKPWARTKELLAELPEDSMLSFVETITLGSGI